MSQTGQITDGPPLVVKVAVGCAVAAIVGGAVALMLVNGPAILLDMAVSAAAFVCL